MRSKRVVQVKRSFRLIAALLAQGACSSAPASQRSVTPVVLPDEPRPVATSSPLVREGESLLAKGDAAGAKARFEAAIASDPRDIRALLDLGLALEALGDARGAESAYRQAVEIDPSFAEALNNLGVLLREAGELEDAISALRHAAEADPTLGSAHENLAMAYEDAGQAEPALQAYTTAVRLSPDDPMLRANYGLFLLKTDKAQQAKAEFRAGLPHADGDRAALLAMGNGLRRVGAPAEAAPVIEQAISAGDGKPTPALLAELSLAQHAAGDERAAKASLESALRLDPQYATAHYLFISMLLSEGDLPGAEGRFKQLRKLDGAAELKRRAKANIEAVRRAR